MQEERKICTELYGGDKKCKNARIAIEGKKAHVYCIHPERFSESYSKGFMVGITEINSPCYAPDDCPELQVEYQISRRRREKKSFRHIIKKYFRK